MSCVFLFSDDDDDGDGDDDDDRWLKPLDDCEFSRSFSVMGHRRLLSTGIPKSKSRR